MLEQELLHLSSYQHGIFLVRLEFEIKLGPLHVFIMSYCCCYCYSSSSCAFLTCARDSKLDTHLGGFHTSIFERKKLVRLDVLYGLTLNWAFIYSRTISALGLVQYNITQCCV